MNPTKRRLLKYATDIFINPAKSIALIFKPTELILSACLVFAVVECLHVSAHIQGALDKYRARKKSYTWMVTKICVKSGRLLASLISAIALSLFTLFARSVFAYIYTVGFIVSSGFSTLHKIRGLYDYVSQKPKTPNKEYCVNRNELIMRAFTGLAGTLLSGAVVLKVPFMVALIANPFTFWLGVGIFTGLALWKVKQTIWEVVQPKHPEKDSKAIAAYVTSTTQIKRVSSPLRTSHSMPALNNRQKNHSLQRSRSFSFFRKAIHLPEENFPETSARKLPLLP